MATRKRISRPSKDARVYTRAGEGPTESIFSELSDDQRRALLDDQRRQEKRWQEERAVHPDSASIADLLKARIGVAQDSPAAIRHGVKTERDTQAVQVRMLKSQIKVLKQIAEQENRSASDVIREVVHGYIMHCLDTWPNDDAKLILQATARQTGYLIDIDRVTVSPETFPKD